MKCIRLGSRDNRRSARNHAPRSSARGKSAALSAAGTAAAGVYAGAAMLGGAVGSAASKQRRTQSQLRDLNSRPTVYEADAVRGHAVSEGGHLIPSRESHEFLCASEVSSNVAETDHTVYGPAEKAFAAFAATVRSKLEAVSRLLDADGVTGARAMISAAISEWFDDGH